MRQASKFGNFTEECRMNKKHPVWLAFAGLVGIAIACWGVPGLGQQIKRITEHPELGHSDSGAKSFVADTGAVIYERNSPRKMTNADEYDVILMNGSIIDGTGNPWVSGDIAIRGDRIATIGKLDGARAKRVIDAKGLVIS